MSTNNLALQAAGFIGTWEADVPTARSVLDEGAAALLTGDASLAGQLIPLEAVLSRTHPDDRGWLYERICRARRTGGSLSAEFRVLTEAGDVRWILNRGNLAPDETGTMHGYGVFLDTTDSHRSPFLPIEPVELRETDPLLVAADRYIEAHAAISQTGFRKLRRLSEMMLFEIGHTLADRTRF